MKTNIRTKFIPDIREIFELIRFTRNRKAKIKTALWILALITPFSVAGALYGYARAYNKFLKPAGYFPDMKFTPTIVRFSMIVFGLIFFALAHLIFNLLIQLFIVHHVGDVSAYVYAILIVLGLNLFFVSFAFRAFNQWQIGINNMLVEGEKFGTARFARPEELRKYTRKAGIYVGGNYTFADKGHILTEAGTRGGKGTNLIIPNLLGIGDYSGSWVVIDPKGENAAITARYQREKFQKVIILNPWDLLKDEVGQGHSYNPLDILADKTNINLVDDVQIIAEMIVPIDKNDKDRFFTDNARSIVAGLLLHLVTDKVKEEQTLTTLWEWVRYKEDDWNNLLADMSTSEDALYGTTVKNAANEILKLMQAGDKTYGSIIATVLQCTDFLKSPALQKSLQSEFDPYELADGKTTLYVIIPADKLKSHARWLRLIVTTTMRAVVRRPNKRVTYVLDEFAALDYLSEIEVALSTYAGFNITLWVVLQSLIQLKGIYHDLWETFIANCTVRQYFTVNDNFSASYVSQAIGQTSHVITTRRWFGVSKSEANQRALMTPDEVRRGSGQNIFAFFGETAPTYFPKLPYYQMSQLNENGKKRYDPNPYMKD